jgi:HTH domain.
MERELTNNEVLEYILDRDRREYPVMTVTEIAEPFDCSRQTVRRRVKELHEGGFLRKNSAGKGNYYWPHEDVGPGKCPECHGVLTRDEEYDPGFTCQRCGTALAQLHDGEETTKYGRTVARGIKMQAWWMELPERVRGFVVTVTTVFMDVDTPEGVDFRPENLTFPGDPAKNGSAREDPDADADADTDTSATASAGRE